MDVLSEYEVQKLNDKMRNELGAGPAAVWRCAAGLLIVIGLAVMGPRFDPLLDRPSDVAQAPQPVHESLARANDGVDQDRVQPEAPSPAAIGGSRFPAATFNLQTVE